MRWYINDLSLWGQFATVADFRAAIIPLLRLRQRSELVRQALYASKMLGTRPVVGELSFVGCLYQGGEELLRRSVLQWITKQGPFLDDDRQQIEDDYFAFEGHDVTDQGLGEAARRCYFNLDAGCFSFVGGPVDCERNPLTVQHGLDDQPLGHINVPNVYEIKGFEKSALAALPIPTSWAELLEQCRLRFDRLVFSDGILKQLRGEPFNSYVCERVFTLLSVLQQYMDQRLPNGERSPVCHRIVATHFTGDKAWFTDESDQNKRKFRNEMTFSDPENGTRQLFCPWHGKIKSPQYRIHFDWPAAPQANYIKVVYIGPKITKD